MIPAHDPGTELASDLAMLVVDELSAVERGIRVLARAVPLEEGVTLDALALDADGKPVMVLMENGEELHSRSVDALVAYRRSRSLLARWFAPDGFDETSDPRLMLVARRFCERTEARCRLLPGAGTTLVEAAVVEGPSGRQVLLLARGGERATKRAPNLRLIGRLAESAPASSDSIVEPAPTRESEAVEKSVPHATPTAAPTTSEEPRAVDSPNWLDELKARILRVSPDVLEEQDGSLSRFRYGEHVLATLSLDAADLLVDFEDGGDPILVANAAACSEVLDIVFERFFNLAATKRRHGAKTAPYARPHEPRVAARMDV